MAELCPDIIFNILLYLSVTTLVRFRCVSKLLCIIIDSPKFIKAHLNTSIQSKTRNKLIILRSKYKVFEEFYATNHRDRLQVLSKLKNPFNLKGYLGTRIIGSCNGLILLQQYIKKDILLWNPSTHQCKKLPGSNGRILNFIRYNYFGLGYDLKRDDYKVVRLGVLRQKLGLWIYSLKSDSWRRLESFTCDNYIFHRTKVGKFVNGSLYWICVHLNTQLNKIIMFDILTEKIQILQVPSLCCSRHNTLHVLKGQLCLGSMKHKHPEHHMAKFSFYIVDSYRNPSWRKIGEYEITHGKPSLSFSEPFSSLEEGDKFMLDLELRTNTCSRHLEPDESVCDGLPTCPESLVALRNGSVALLC